MIKRCSPLQVWSRFELRLLFGLNPVIVIYKIKKLSSWTSSPPKAEAKDAINVFGLFTVTDHSIHTVENTNPHSDYTSFHSPTLSLSEESSFVFTNFFAVERKWSQSEGLWFKFCFQKQCCFHYAYDFFGVYRSIQKLPIMCCRTYSLVDKREIERPACF